MKTLATIFLGGIFAVLAFLAYEKKINPPIEKTLYKDTVLTTVIYNKDVILDTIPKTTESYWYVTWSSSLMRGYDCIVLPTQDFSLIKAAENLRKVAGCKEDYFEITSVRKISKQCYNEFKNNKGEL